ncbi:hypothetical protein EMCRGX_G003415 [Ephydatia muelleri]
MWSASISTIGGSKPSASGTLLFLCQCDVVEPLSSQWDHHSLQCPSTQYSFVEAACTTAGCQTGGVANVTTLDSVRFHAYNPSGILFYQINSVITDFLGVKMHGGLPWLIFDVGSGPAVVGSNSTRTFIDGQWHTGHVVLFEQASNTFYVTVDTVHAAAITDVIVPLLTMKVYFEGFPSTRADMALQPLTACVLSPPEWYLAPDGFDAVSVQNVGSTYIIVSWDLPTHSNGILINFSLYCNGALAGVLPLTVISYNTTGLLPFTFYMYITLSVGQVLQSRPQALHSSWNVVLGVISAAASLPRHKRFHTLFDLVKYGLMSKYNVMCSSLDPMEELTATPPYPS